MDKTGKRFGRLKVLGDSGLRSSDRCVIWGCLCDCGVFSLVPTFNLGSGNTNSCGCLRKEKTAMNGKKNRLYSKIEAKRIDVINKAKSQLKLCKNLSDSYVRNVLIHRTSLTSTDIPLELIKLKRAEITARRLLKREEIVK